MEVQALRLEEFLELLDLEGTVCQSSEESQI